jgi:hypothetical protein
MTFLEVVSSARRCRFPTGDNTNGEDEWCGRDTGSPFVSWCVEHRARVFLPEENAPRLLRLPAIEAGHHRANPVTGGDPQPGWGSGDERRSREFVR